MSDENKKTVAEILDSSIYATKKELNEEARIRAESDEGIITDFTILRKTTNKKIEDISEKVKGIDPEPIKEQVDDLADKVSTAEENIKNNQERIDNIEGCFLNQIKELETENEALNEKLSEASQTIVEKNGVIAGKNEEIEKLREEIRSSAGPNQINLTFAEPPKFTIEQVMSVKEFINNHLKEVIVARMLMRHPNAEWGRDYSLLIDGLAYNDVMQGKIVPVTLYAVEDSQLLGKSTFDIIVTHQYDAVQQQKFIEQFLQPTIPTSLWGVAENASPNYNVPKEIAVTAPLKLLLNSQEFKHLTFKIFGEMNAASYWTDFQRSWQFINSNYVGTGQSTIGGTKIINGATDLYNNTVGYHNKIYQLIEQRLNDSGVPCKVTKKWARHSSGSSMIHTLGNLTFNVTNINLDDNETFITKSRDYYMMINFDLTLNDQTKKFYRGVTLVLSDNLELYA